MVATPTKNVGVGRNRTRSVLRSSRADVPVTVPMEAQVLPPLIEYSQTPPVPVYPVTAMPLRAPASGSVIDGPAKDSTVSPTGAGVGAVTCVRFGVLAASTGASFTGLTVITGELVAELTAVPPPVAKDCRKSTVVPIAP